MTVSIVNLANMNTKQNKNTGNVDQHQLVITLNLRLKHNIQTTRCVVYSALKYQHLAER